MLVRRASPSDVPELVTLWTEFMVHHEALDDSLRRRDDAADLWSQYLVSRLDADRTRVLVAEAEQRLVGYAVATISEYPPIYTETEYGFIQEIVVHQGRRRRGIGRRLVAAAEAWLDGRGIRRIELKVDVLNEASRAFWQAVGYERNTESLLKKLP
jgi:GNAT superfamily N-acetyltransferase